MTSVWGPRKIGVDHIKKKRVSVGIFVFIIIASAVV